MNSNQMDGTFWAIYSLIVLILAVTSIVSFWRIFEKAGDKGWKSLIPLYNTYTLFKVAGYNGWMFLLLLIPIVNIVILLLLSLKLAERFGKSTVFAVVALFLFNPIGFWIIGLGDAKYKEIKE
jgi:Zn-dependent protease with chaperone function